MSETNMNKIIKHIGFYKDVFFEINQNFSQNLKKSFNREDSHWWTYYIDIELEKIPKKYNPDSFWLPLERYELGKHHGTMYNYDNHTTLNNIYFYCGITFYSKVTGLEEGEKKIIKVGCDFNHAWDMERGYAYSYEDIYSHVIKTIHSLHDEIQGYGVEL